MICILYIDYRYTAFSFLTGHFSIVTLSYVGSPKN